MNAEGKTSPIALEDARWKDTQLTLRTGGNWTTKKAVEWNYEEEGHKELICAAISNSRREYQRNKELTEIIWQSSACQLFRYTDSWKLSNLRYDGSSVGFWRKYFLPDLAPGNTICGEKGDLARNFEKDLEAIFCKDPDWQCQSCLGGLPKQRVNKAH